VIGVILKGPHYGSHNEGDLPASRALLSLWPAHPPWTHSGSGQVCSRSAFCVALNALRTLRIHLPWLSRWRSRWRDFGLRGPVRGYV